MEVKSGRDGLENILSAYPQPSYLHPDISVCYAGAEPPGKERYMGYYGKREIAAALIGLALLLGVITTLLVLGPRYNDTKRAPASAPMVQPFRGK